MCFHMSAADGFERYSWLTRLREQGYEDVAERLENASSFEFVEPNHGEYYGILAEDLDGALNEVKRLIVGDMAGTMGTKNAGERLAKGELCLAADVIDLADAYGGRQTGVFLTLSPVTLN